MVFFGDQNNVGLSEGLALGLNVPVLYPDVKVFPDGERRVGLTQKVVDEDVVFLKTASITPNIDSFVIELGFLIDAIKRSGASNITGVIPYIPYSRADHLFADGESVPVEVVIHFLESAGLSKVIHVDPHALKIEEMFTIPQESLTALPLFADKIRNIGFDPKDCALVSPDMGGLRKVKMLSQLLDNAPYIILEKERDHVSGGVTVSKMTGEVKKRCFVIDDIISSGGTIIKALEQLEKKGAEEMHVFATHGILSENASSILQASKAKKVYITDSIPVAEGKQFKKLEVISLAKVIASKLV